LNKDLLFEQSQALNKGDWITIDEVQKIPKLLDIVHKAIEENHIRFALSGSSARKLKRGGANLLAGRAFVFYLFPITHQELGPDFNLESTLQWGTLPKIYQQDNAQDKARFLKAYTQTYLKEEIQVEQLNRINTYRELDYQLSFLRTKDNAEIDLIITRPGNSTMLVEIKSYDRIDSRHLTALQHFESDFPKAELICVSRVKTSQKVGDIWVLPWQEFFENL
jgi:predicted AAA+ superfamily ATPase